MFCCKHSNSIYGESQTYSPSRSKTCDEVPKGDFRLCIKYESYGEITLHGFTDSYWEGSAKYRKRTSGCFFTLKSSMISWFSRSHTNIALSTTGAEYILARSTCSEAVWLLKMLEILFDVDIDVTNILCDNQSCIKMIENSVFHDKMKHIEVRYHYNIHDMVQKGVVKLKYVPTEEQVVDFLTKPLSRVNFE